MTRLLHFDALLPLIPQLPFNPHGEKGGWGVPTTATGDGTQMLSRKTCPCQGRTRGCTTSRQAGSGDGSGMSRRFRL
jgi:hypothetical protein